MANNYDIEAPARVVTTGGEEEEDVFSSSSSCLSKSESTGGTTPKLFPHKPSDKPRTTASTLHHLAALAASVRAFTVVGFKWIMTVLVRKLLMEAAGGNGSSLLEVSGSRAAFWSVIFLDELSFVTVVVLAFTLVSVLVMAAPILELLSTAWANHNSQVLRRQLLESCIVACDGEKASHNENASDDESTTVKEDEQSAVVQSAPNLLIGQIKIIHEYQADHEFPAITEKLVVFLCIVLIFIFTWRGGLIGLGALFLAEGLTYLLAQCRRPVLEMLEDKIGYIQSHLLDVLKNADEVIVAQTWDKEIATLKIMEEDLDPIVSKGAQLQAINTFCRFGTHALVPILLALASWPLVSDNEQTEDSAVNAAFGVIAAILLLDEAHKSIVHLTFLEEKRLDAISARKRIDTFFMSRGRKGSGIGGKDKLEEDGSEDTLRTIFESTSCWFDAGEDSATAATKGQPVSSDSLVIHNLTVRYPGAQRAVIQSLNLKLEANKVHGIVGDSGCGKSTLVKVMADLVPREEGAVSFPTGRPPKIAYMPQASASTLFARSVRENVSYGKDNISDEEIWEALQLAEIDDMVRTLPNGLDTVLNFGESEISGGERQRLQLARLFCTGRDSELVLVDEALSELDPKRRSILLERMTAFLKGKTAIVVTHHDDVTKMCDDVHNLSECGERHGERKWSARRLGL